MAVHTCFDPMLPGINGGHMRRRALQSFIKTRTRRMVVEQALKRTQAGWSGVIYRRDPIGDQNPGMK